MKIIKKNKPASKPANNTASKPASKPASNANNASKASNKAMLAELEALKAALAAAEEKAAQAEERVISLTSQIKKGSQPRSNSTFTASCQAILAGIGKGYLTLTQGGEALGALTTIANTVDQRNEAIKYTIASKLRHNIISNIKKQKDDAKASASIDNYIGILTMVNANIVGNDIDLDKARNEVEAARNKA